MGSQDGRPVNILNQKVIREEGGIQALIKLLREGSQNACKPAASALGNLAMNSANQNAICSAGGIKALTEVISKNFIEAQSPLIKAVQVNAANALRNLAKHSLSQRKILLE